MIKNIFLPAILTMLLSVSSTAYSANDNLITDNGVGSVKLGMTYNQVKSILKSYKSNLYTGDCNSSEFSGLIFKIGTTGNIGVSDLSCNKSKIVKQINICSSNFKTKEGIRPGMKMSELLKIYPRLKIEKGMDDIETFSPNTYSNLTIEFMSNNDGSLIGKYQDAEFNTTNFSKNAKVGCLIIDKRN
jgi:hypothetical protein